MFITVSGEFAALTYLRKHIAALRSFSSGQNCSPLCRVCEQCACTALTADWLLPGSVCNQSDGAVGGQCWRQSRDYRQRGAAASEPK